MLSRMRTGRLSLSQPAKVTDKLEAYAKKSVTNKPSEGGPNEVDKKRKSSAQHTRGNYAFACYSGC